MQFVFGDLSCYAVYGFTICSIVYTSIATCINSIAGVSIICSQHFINSGISIYVSANLKAKLQKLQCCVHGLNPQKFLYCHNLLLLHKLFNDNGIETGKKLYSIAVSGCINLYSQYTFNMPWSRCYLLFSKEMKHLFFYETYTTEYATVA